MTGLGSQESVTIPQFCTKLTADETQSHLPLLFSPPPAQEESAGKCDHCSPQFIGEEDEVPEAGTQI